MKALVYEGPRVMTMREVEKPQVEEHEVLIRVVKAGICGSELSGYLGQNSLRVPPLIMGHEFSGEVVEVGERVRDIQLGDRVTANPLITCGNCIFCKTGQQNLCEDRSLIGAHLPGAYAEYVKVPAQNVYRLEDSISYDDGALVEPFACGVHIARIAQFSPTDQLLILGAGPIGMFVLETAKIYGVNQIVVLDINEERLEIARELGAVTCKSEKELSRVKPSTGFDVSVDAVGLEITRNQCITLTRNGGRVIFSGLHASDSSLPINHLIRNENIILGAFAYNTIDFELALKWLSQKQIKLTNWMESFPLEEGKDCFEKLLGNPGKVAKILLEV